MNKPFSILLFFLLLSCSCSRKLLPSSTNTTIVDHNTTVTERIVWQSKIITLPVEHTQQVTFEDSSHLETSLAISDARIMADGRLFHSLKNKTNFFTRQYSIFGKRNGGNKRFDNNRRKNCRSRGGKGIVKMAKNTDKSWIHRYRFHIVFRLQNSPKVRVTFGLILLGIDKIYGA